jgi:hypothetical protein
LTANRVFVVMQGAAKTARTAVARKAAGRVNSALSKTPHAALMRVLFP